MDKSMVRGEKLHLVPKERNRLGIHLDRPLHKLRLDDSTDKEDIRVTLYRDSASWCPYCPKSVDDTRRETHHQSEHAMLRR
mmetsp:Transcript_27872/g.28274  ORF Transcript_27872/g.28274 Transcript_27872/m.28274 type:complete len:81 (+) Transcript_27872:526-768(+)